MLLSCIITYSVGAITLLVGIILWKKNKEKQALLDKIDRLKKTAGSWPDSPIADFDPTTVITLDSFEEMKSRLRNRIVDRSLEGPNPYGAPSSFVDKISDHLIDGFEFSTVIDKLSPFQHYKTVIGDVNLHFIHMVGAEEKRNRPILLLHGWPSTILEFHKSIPYLLDQGFTVVAPSLPCHGFTTPPTKPGVSPAVIATVYAILMRRLGYANYVVHGGDWGAIIGRMLTMMYPDRVLGLHVTLNTVSMGPRFALQSIVGFVFPRLVYKTKGEEGFLHPVSKLSERQYKGMAYFHAQSVIGEFYGYGMNDSPTGLIGWIGAIFPLASAEKAFESVNEKLRIGLENFGLDNVCANLVVFWATRTAQCSMRIYHEFYWKDMDMYKQAFIKETPVAISNFPNEIVHSTRFASGDSYGNIKLFNYHDFGGHFSHIDNTEGVVTDLISFVSGL